MADVSNLGLVTVFAAGIISFLSPCVLPLVPAYVSYVAGHDLAHLHHREPFTRKLSALALSLCFVLGFTGQLSAFALWLLNTFPIFSAIG